MRPTRKILRQQLLVLAVIALGGLNDAGANNTQFRRPRGDGMLHCQSANTMGAGTIWVTGRANCFIWDDNEETGGANFFPFPELRIDAGIVDFIALIAEGRLLSYGRPDRSTYPEKLQPGDLSAGLRATLPNNKDLRYNGLGLELRYHYNALKGFASVAGYRVGGTGFSPEGWVVEGGALDWKVLFERDYLARYSNLPLKVMLNAGMRIPLTAEYVPYSQYHFSAAIGYVGMSAEAFVEYSMINFVNRGVEPKLFAMAWWKDNNGLPVRKTWEVAFSENPMYLTIGGKVRYPRGISLNAAVPVLLSINQGSDITYGGHRQRLHEDFPDEARRGVNDPFDPWYAKWKVIGWLSFPLRYRQTGAEMRRSFLLMKSNPQKARIDIDERLRSLELQESDPADEQKRLEEIRKRREQQNTETPESR